MHTHGKQNQHSENVHLTQHRTWSSAHMISMLPTLFITCSFSMKIEPQLRASACRILVCCSWYQTPQDQKSITVLGFASDSRTSRFRPWTLLHQRRVRTHTQQPHTDSSCLSCKVHPPSAPAARDGQLWCRRSPLCLFPLCILRDVHHNRSEEDQSWTSEEANLHESFKALNDLQLTVVIKAVVGFILIKLTNSENRDSNKSGDVLSSLSSDASVCVFDQSHQRTGATLRFIKATKQNYQSWTLNCWSFWFWRVCLAGLTTKAQRMTDGSWSASVWDPLTGNVSKQSAEHSVTHENLISNVQWAAAEKCSVNTWQLQNRSGAKSIHKVTTRWLITHASQPLLNLKRLQKPLPPPFFMFFRFHVHHSWPGGRIIILLKIWQRNHTQMRAWPFQW